MKKSLVVCLLTLFAFAACGQKDQSVAKKAGDKVGQTITDFASGVGKGIDKRLEVSVEVSKELADRGVSATMAKRGGKSKNAVSVYLISQKPLRGKLVGKALDKDGLERGRAVVDATFLADDAKYLSFDFPDEMEPQWVAKYRIDLRQVR